MNLNAISFIDGKVTIEYKRVMRMASPYLHGLLGNTAATGTRWCNYRNHRMVFNRVLAIDIQTNEGWWFCGQLNHRCFILPVQIDKKLFFEWWGSVSPGLIQKLGNFDQTEGRGKGSLGD